MTLPKLTCNRMEAIADQTHGAAGLLFAGPPRGGGLRQAIAGLTISVPPARDWPSTSPQWVKSRDRPFPRSGKSRRPRHSFRRRRRPASSSAPAA